MSACRSARVGWDTSWLGWDLRQRGIELMQHDTAPDHTIGVHDSPGPAGRQRAIDLREERMRNTVTLSIFLSVLAIQPAVAETNLSLYIGKSFTDDSDLRLRQPNSTQLTFHGVSWSDHSFEMPIYYGGRVTHFFKSQPDWGVALDFFHYKVYSDTNAVLPVTGTRGGAPVGGSERLGDTIQKFNISHGVNYLTL